MCFQFNNYFLLILKFNASVSKRISKIQQNVKFLLRAQSKLNQIFRLSILNIYKEKNSKTSTLIPKTSKAFQTALKQTQHQHTSSIIKHKAHRVSIYQTRYRLSKEKDTLTRNWKRLCFETTFSNKLQRVIKASSRILIAKVKRGIQMLQEYD